MILRAAFWIAVVALFIPREPDVGFGRPGTPSIVPPRTAEWIARSFHVPPCEDGAQCLGGLSWAADFRTDMLERLERAKADLKAHDPDGGVTLKLPHY
jgi:hypothetical protein